MSEDKHKHTYEYALMVSGGKQHRVKVGHKVKLETLKKQVEGRSVVVDQGDTVAFDQVLLIANGEDVQLGRPTINGARVLATVLGHGRGDKITIIKFRRRQNSRSKQGHRQDFTEVQITAIEA